MDFVLHDKSIILYTCIPSDLTYDPYNSSMDQTKLYRYAETSVMHYDAETNEYIIINDLTLECINYKGHHRVDGINEIKYFIDNSYYFIVSRE